MALKLERRLDKETRSLLQVNSPIYKIAMAWRSGWNGVQIKRHAEADLEILEIVRKDKDV